MPKCALRIAPTPSPAPNVGWLLWIDVMERAGTLQAWKTRRCSGLHRLRQHSLSSRFSTAQCLLLLSLPLVGFWPAQIQIALNTPNTPISLKSLSATLSLLCWEKSSQDSLQRNSKGQAQAQSTSTAPCAPARSPEHGASGRALCPRQLQAAIPCPLSGKPEGCTFRKE